MKGKFHIRVVTSLENIQLQGGAQNIIYRWKYNRGGDTDTAQNSKTKTDRGGGTAYNQSRWLAGWLSIIKVPILNRNLQNSKLS